jgi:hypothetical protein
VCMRITLTLICRIIALTLMCVIVKSEMLDYFFVMTGVYDCRVNADMSEYRVNYDM